MAASPTIFDSKESKEPISVSQSENYLARYQLFKGQPIADVYFEQYLEAFRSELEHARKNLTPDEQKQFFAKAQTTITTEMRTAHPCLVDEINAFASRDNIAEEKGAFYALAERVYSDLISGHRKISLHEMNYLLYFANQLVKAEKFRTAIKYYQQLTLITRTRSREYYEKAKTALSNLVTCLECLGDTPERRQALWEVSQISLNSDETFYTTRFRCCYQLMLVGHVPAMTGLVSLTCGRNSVCDTDIICKMIIERIPTDSKVVCADAELLKLVSYVIDGYYVFSGGLSKELRCQFLRLLTYHPRWDFYPAMLVKLIDYAREGNESEVLVKHWIKERGNELPDDIKETKRCIDYYIIPRFLAKELRKKWHETWLLTGEDKFLEIEEYLLQKYVKGYQARMDNTRDYQTRMGPYREAVQGRSDALTQLDHIRARSLVVAMMKQAECKTDDMRFLKIYIANHADSILAQTISTLLLFTTKEKELIKKLTERTHKPNSFLAELLLAIVYETEAMQARRVLFSHQTELHLETYAKSVRVACQFFQRAFSSLIDTETKEEAKHTAIDPTMLAKCSTAHDLPQATIRESINNLQEKMISHIKEIQLLVGSYNPVKVAPISHTMYPDGRTICVTTTALRPTKAITQLSSSEVGTSIFLTRCKQVFDLAATMLTMIPEEKLGIPSRREPIPTTPVSASTHSGSSSSSLAAHSLIPPATPITVTAMSSTVPIPTGRAS